MRSHYFDFNKDGFPGRNTVLVVSTVDPYWGVSDKGMGSTATKLEESSSRILSCTRTTYPFSTRRVTW